MKKFLFLFLLCAGFFGVPAVSSAQSATLFFSPASQTVQPGSVFPVTIMVNTGGVQVNAVAAYFSYPADKLEAVQVSTTGSVMQFPVEREASGGQARISGGSPTPGFSGVQPIGSVQFRALSSLGTATLSFMPDSAVMTNADNQNILSVAGSGVAAIQITAASPLPPPPPPPASPPPTSPSPLPAEFTITDIRAEKLSSERALLFWKTSQDTRGEVHYGPSAEEDYRFSFFGGVLTSEHVAVLSGVRAPFEYALEIVGVDEFGNQARTERLLLAELLPEKVQPPGIPGIVKNGMDIGGFAITAPLIFMFVVLPLLVILLAAFLFFFRMRARA